MHVPKSVTAKIAYIFSSVADPDPHLKSPPGSGSAWTDADLDPGGKKSLENEQVHEVNTELEDQK